MKANAKQLLIGLLKLGICLATGIAFASSSTNFLVPAFHPGDRIDNIFSRTISIHAEGFDEKVSRVSGTASYRVLKDQKENAYLQIDYHYDGQPAATGTVAFKESGAISCFNGKCSPNTDASGLVYNAAQWGAPRERLAVGQHWNVQLVTPWELGTPGTQTVTVRSIDSPNHGATLERDGRGEGAFADEKLQTTITRDGKSYSVALEPGAAHWFGMTTFRDGVVFSDELMVERSLIVVSNELGRIAATERQYILLNQMRPSS